MILIEDEEYEKIEVIEEKPIELKGSVGIL